MTTIVSTPQTITDAKKKMVYDYVTSTHRITDGFQLDRFELNSEGTMADAWFTSKNSDVEEHRCLSKAELKVMQLFAIEVKINDLTILRDTRIAKNPGMDNDYFDAYIEPVNNEIIALKGAIVLANQL